MVGVHQLTLMGRSVEVCVSWARYARDLGQHDNAEGPPALRQTLSSTGGDEQCALTWWEQSAKALS